MDRVELTAADVIALLAWRDEHKELVRAMPAPLKAVEIILRHNNLRIKGIREDDMLRLHLNLGGRSLGNARFRVDSENKALILVRSTLKIKDEDLKSVLTGYCSLMALMTYGTKTSAKPCEKRERKATPNKAKLSTHKPTKRITYIIKRTNGTLQAVPEGSHASPRGEFTVRGYYRHYKSGKIVWIAEYRKGSGKKKSKTYRMGGKMDV